MKRTTLTSTLLVTISFLWASVIPGQAQVPMAEEEQQAMSDTLQYALEHNRTSQGASWVNPDTSRSGAVVPTHTFVDGQGRPCREFTTTITIYGEQQRGYGTACRSANGTWYVVSDGPPARVASVTRRPVYVYPPPKPYYVPPYTYYNPFNINFSFSYLFHGGSLHFGNYYPISPIWYPNINWKYKTHRYRQPYRHKPRPHYRPHNRPHYRPHYRPHNRR